MEKRKWEGYLGTLCAERTGSWVHVFMPLLKIDLTMFWGYEVAVYSAFQFFYSNVQVCKLFDSTFDITVFKNHAKQYLI